MKKQKARENPVEKKAKRKLGGYGKNVQKCQKNSQSNRSGCPACGGWTREILGTGCRILGWGMGSWIRDKGHTKCWPAGGDGSSINDGYTERGLGLGSLFPFGVGDERVRIFTLE